MIQICQVDEYTSKQASEYTSENRFNKAILVSQQCLFFLNLRYIVN